MNVRLAGYVLASLLVAAALGASWNARGADAPYLPGITSSDPNPEGCVSCHKGTMLLKTKLDALKHRNIDGKVEVIPTDCKSCHSEEGGLDTIGNIAHSMHYASGSTSDFVVKHQGSCLNCHALATGNGEVTVKSGKRNW
jgi:hypothetical protein